MGKYNYKIAIIIIGLLYCFQDYTYKEILFDELYLGSFKYILRIKDKSL